MSDLRERLGRLFACRCDPAWTERRLHAPDCVEELGGDAITEVAEWLREEAAQLRKPGPGRMPEGDAIRRIEANALDVRAQRLADSLTRKEPTGE